MNSAIKEKKFDAWRHGLLDISKRNKLMNYKRSKRTTLQITMPDMCDLYRRLVIDGESISFRKQISTGDNLHLAQLFYIMEKMNAPIELSEGEIRSDLSSSEMNQTLKNLRAKAKLSLEEQGINILYLSFGFLKWRLKPGDSFILSPLILVPVAIEIESILSPYYIKRLEEDIVINPTLEYALSSEYGISLPDFDPLTDDIEAYLDNVHRSVAKNGWAVEKEANIGLLSFLKIVMYKDLEKYKDRIFSNPVVQAFCGDTSSLPLIDESLLDYSHDQTPAIDHCQVVNADASQQDAIMLSRKGISFVLQGPPGTGKSQTITNIIAQALADKKKVLFVSEKMAALSVVYRRLEEVGLTNYCLSLHNYKAERRTVIQDLVNTLDAPTISIKAGVTDALQVLEKERAQLNDYIEEIHKVRTPLNRSIYEVITELVSEENLELFRISEDTIHTDEKEFAARIAVLRQFSDFLEHYDGDIYTNPWRKSRITAVTYDIRNAIANELNVLVGYLFGLSSSMSYLEQKYGLNQEWSLNRFNQLLQYTIRALVLNEVENKLVTKADRTIFTQDSKEILEEACHKFHDALNLAKSAGLPATALIDVPAVEAERNRYVGIKEHAERSSSLLKALQQSTSISLEETPAGLEKGRALLLALNIKHQVLPVWFSSQGYEKTRGDVHHWKTLADEAAVIKKKIDAQWDAGIYRINHVQLLDRFIKEYSSFLKRLGSQYKSDKNEFLSLRKGRPTKLDDKECIAVLQLLRDHADAEARFFAAAKDAAYVLGPYYVGIETNWDEIEAILAECEAADSFFKRYGMSDVVLMHLAKPYTERIRTILAGMSIGTIEAAIGAFDRELATDTGISSSYAEQRKVSDERISALDAYYYALSVSRRTISSFLTTHMAVPERVDQYSTTFDALINMIRSGSELRKSVDEYFQKDQWPMSKELLDEMVELYEEQINRTSVSMRAEGLKDCYESLQSGVFSKAIGYTADCVCSPDQIQFLQTYKEWFPDNDCDTVPIQDLIDQITQCQNIERLQSWIRFSNISNECSNHHLEDYLKYVETHHTNVDEIVALYRKSFLTKWLIDTLAIDDLPYLQSFQSYAHEKVISRFEISDRNQMQIAQARLADILSHEKPSGINLLASAMDEATILRREAEKKRRIIPLRKLFKTIPTLLQKLKPCFMMSPLSVSYFLDSDMYNFDLIIFDEASQILPEDAIGAIYRGKQVIIAGDTKQMPPTSFFSAASKNSDDYDVEEDSDEYYPDVVSESILDEAVTCLPSCTLLWHYRSRDESLISFSNQQLYNNNLITFPNCSRLKDRGLEYVYVPNGYYEGSGKNCNVEEAQKCLALVIDHIKNHPDRSLGIVAFSEKQQGVIEDVINDYRLKNPQYEDFFDESKEEPFFVKNLENVQGDERDTIIFSICYAKNAQGRMYQRFGPLGHDGGERRLNVAITRAKYNVKLVGSIMPTDIVVKEGTKDGIRMLREYIYYAMQNDYAIPASTATEINDHFSDQIVSYICPAFLRKAPMRL